MTIQQALSLISPTAPFLSSGSPRYWADLGCGSGLFTMALAQLLPTGSTIYGVDTHPTIRRQDKPTSIIPIQTNFIKDTLGLPPLDGILMANSLHYVEDKPTLLQKLRSYMHPDSPFIIVEYDTDKAVPTWVPYPISYTSLTELFKGQKVQKLDERPSVFGRANMYAAFVSPQVTFH